MNKTQLVDALAERLGDRRTAAAAVDGLLETVVETVRSGETVTLTGFGVFESRARAARTARNPRTGETVAVPATTVPAFRPGAGFRAAVGAAQPSGSESAAAAVATAAVATAAVDTAAVATAAVDTAAAPAKQSKGGKAAEAKAKEAKEAKPAAKEAKGKGREKKDQDKAGKGKKARAKK